MHICIFMLLSYFSHSVALVVALPPVLLAVTETVYLMHCWRLLMSRDREKEFPGKDHGPSISCLSSATSTEYLVTDGRDVELGNCAKVVTVTV